MLLRSSLVCAAALAIASSAGAQGTGTSIYVDIGSLGYGSGVPASTFSGAAASPGTWNALDMDLVTGALYVTPPLVDTSGATTPVTLQWDGVTTPPLNIEFDEPNTFGDDQALLDDAGYNAGFSEFTFTGLPAGVYDVITYAMAPDNAAYLTNVSVMGSLDPPQDVGGDFSLGYVLGTTHALHTVSIGAGMPLTIQVDVTSSFDTINGIQVMLSNSTGGIGTSYCGPAVMNSTGSPAEISVTGSTSVALNNVTLHCGQMPQNAFGFFLVSQSQGFVMSPGGSQGNLCLGGAIGRYVGPGQVQNSGTTGEISLVIDLTMIPSPTGFIAAQAGDTFNFTTWFRDAVGGMATSNFSDGSEVVFQ